jgi:hypothetical protein
VADNLQSLANLLVKVQYIREFVPKLPGKRHFSRSAALQVAVRATGSARIGRNDG